MSTVTLGGNPVEVAGPFPRPGQTAPAFTARALVVLDGNDRVLHAQLVPEIKDEPDYAAAIRALGP